MSRADFWSRRKAAVRAEEVEAETSATPPAPTADEATAEDLPDEELLAQLGLPDPDSLSEGDDFSGFMAKTVPQHLRRRALRRLWVSNPVLANADGLLDYADDFTDAATVMPDMKTAYQVGRGMMRHIQAMMEEKEPGEPAPVAEESETVIALEEHGEIPLEDESAPEESVAPPLDPQDVPRPPRHMRFEYS